MATHIVSIDAGNGGTNAVRAMKSGGYKQIYFPSVRASATGESLGLGKDLELQYDYVDWGSHRYVIGDDVLRVTRRHMERHQGAFRYGDEFHRFLISVAVGKLGIRSGSVDLTLFAPPGMYVQARELLQKRLFEHGATTMIQFKGDKKPRRWTYENVTVWPEGLGAAACFALDEKGEVVANDLLSGETVILDMGVYTLDALKLTDGNFNPEMLEHATWENGGISTHILQPVLRAIKKTSNDFSILTPDDIDLCLRTGLTTGDYTLRLAGYEVDLKPLIDRHSERYAEWIANNIIDGVFNGLRGIRSAILIGGGHPLTERWLRKWYAEKIVDPTPHITGKKIAAVDMNAVGGLRLSLARVTS